MNALIKKLFILACTLLVACGASAQGLSIDAFTVAGGSDTVSGGNFSISGSVGQPDAGLELSGGDFSIFGGFWSVIEFPDSVSAPITITAFEIIGNDLRLTFTTVAGKNYALQSRADLSSGDWDTVPGGPTPGTGDTVQVTLTGAFNQPQQFYRVQQLP